MDLEQSELAFKVFCFFISWITVTISGLLCLTVLKESWEEKKKGKGTRAIGQSGRGRPHQTHRPHHPTHTSK